MRGCAMLREVREVSRPAWLVAPCESTGSGPAAFVEMRYARMNVLRAAIANNHAASPHRAHLALVHRLPRQLLAVFAYWTFRSF